MNEPTLHDHADAGQERSLNRILEISLPVAVTVASKRIRMKDVLAFKPGLIVEFDKSADGQLEVQVNGRTVAQGYAVKTGEKYGLRVENIGAPEDRIRAITG
jgi:flagellar motor switch protein FliN/FliY